MVTKTVMCPTCKEKVTVQGNPGEKISIRCSKCGLKGVFTFPREKPGRLDVAIDVDGLTKIFNGFKAVDDVSFRVKHGEIFGFLGPNGAGKTTTIKSILGLIHVDSGRVRINGFDVRKKGREVKKFIGYVPERIAFYDNLTSLQTLYFFCDLKNEDRSLAFSLLKEVGLEKDADKKVGAFSKGMVQLLGIAQAMIGNPSIYILDEPMIGLDARWVKIIRDKIKMLNENGATVLFSSHILSEVQNLCDRVAIINKGKLIAEDTMSNLNRYLKIKPRLEIFLPGLNGKVPDVIPKLENVESVEAKGDKLLVTCEADIRVQVISALKEKGFTIKDIRTIEPSLEEVFMKLISK
jgi:ABC-2 type transport system ATP-binding protein